MCLLITGNFVKLKTTLLTTPGLLDDIFFNNADGVGVMYENEGQVAVRKQLPATLDELTAWLTSLKPTNPEQQAAIHFRMRTHGDIDLEQCHPYPIPGTGAWLMHNGILHSGNADDKTKSDTWHYAKNVLAPIALQSESSLHMPAIQYLLSRDIGNTNKFATLTPDGQLSVTNRASGVEHDGLWFSNTYAWSPELLIPSHKPAYAYYSSGFKSHDYGVDYQHSTRKSKWAADHPFELPAVGSANSERELACDFVIDVLAGNLDDLIDYIACLSEQELIAALSYLFTNYQYTVIFSDGPCMIETMTPEQLATMLKGEDLAALLIDQTYWEPRESYADKQGGLIETNSTYAG